MIKEVDRPVVCNRRRVARLRSTSDSARGFPFKENSRSVYPGSYHQTGRYSSCDDSPFQRASSIVLLFESTELSKARRARSQVQPRRMFQRKPVFSNILQRLLVRTPLTFRIRICFQKKLSYRFHSMLGFNQISGLKCRDRVIISLSEPLRVSGGANITAILSLTR